MEEVHEKDREGKDNQKACVRLKCVWRHGGWVRGDTTVTEASRGADSDREDYKDSASVLSSHSRTRSLIG